MSLGTLPEVAALAPAATLAFAAFLVLVADAIDPDADSAGLLVAVSVGGALTALAITVWYLFAGTGQPSSGGAILLFDGQIIVDGMALFITAIVASVTALVALASYDYLVDHPYRAEFYSLTLLSATGMALVAASNSFVVAFLSIELVSLPSYALVASLKSNRGSVEAGLKYFLIGALSSAILAYGISLVYAATGSLAFEEVKIAVTSVDNLTGGAPLLGLGILMILGGFAFKIAAVPFHFWAPAAYEGAPAPISAFLSSASKAAGFVITFRVFGDVFPQAASGVSEAVDWVVAVQVIAIVTMFVANFAALRQEKVKRMLAYSSIGHAGFVLIAVAALTGSADKGFVLGSGLAHLLVYGFMNTGAFLFIALTEFWGVGDGEGATVEDYNGLATQAPFACAMMTIFLYSLAGLPLGGGFLSKFYLLWASIDGGVALLGVALVINSVVSVYYYTRIVKAMWVEEPENPVEITQYPLGLYAALAAAALMTILLLPGFGFVVDFAETAAQAVV